MAVDRRHVGHEHPAFEGSASAERSAGVSQAIGVKDPSPRIAPPALMQAIEGDNNNSSRILEPPGVDLRRRPRLDSLDGPRARLAPEALNAKGLAVILGSAQIELAE